MSVDKNASIAYFIRVCWFLSSHCSNGLDWSAAYMQSLFCMIVLRPLTVRWLVEYFEYSIFETQLNQRSYA